MPPKKKFWTKAEEDAIRAGVKKFGVGSWAEIKSHSKVLAGRTNVNIKDKWRTLSKTEAAPAPSDSSSDSSGSESDSDDESSDDEPASPPVKKVVKKKASPAKKVVQKKKAASPKVVLKPRRAFGSNKTTLPAPAEMLPDFEVALLRSEHDKLKRENERLLARVEKLEKTGSGGSRSKSKADTVHVLTEHREGIGSVSKEIDGAEVIGVYKSCKAATDAIIRYSKGEVNEPDEVFYANDGDDSTKNWYTIEDAGLY